MAEYSDARAEGERQDELTASLGQVPCRYLHNGWPACKGCGAVL